MEHARDPELHVSHYEEIRCEFADPHNPHRCTSELMDIGTIGMCHNCRRINDEEYEALNDLDVMGMAIAGGVYSPCSRCEKTCIAEVQYGSICTYDTKYHKWTPKESISDAY